MEDKLEKNGFKKPWNLSRNESLKVRIPKMISWIFVKEKKHLGGVLGMEAHGILLLKMRGCELGF